MTTKILTIRVPSPVYASLCRDAGELGVPVSAHVRRLIEHENDSMQLDQMRRELLNRLDNLAALRPLPNPDNSEMLLLCRAIASHLSPQLVSQVRAKLAQQS